MFFDKKEFDGKKTYDYVVIGGGIIGLTLALELRKQTSGEVILIEKEVDVAKHASGRNSGVIHAGFYYTESSYKARLTKQGNRLLHDYCHRKNIRVNNCGKYVVCKNEEELSSLELLYERAKKYEIEIEKISSEQLAKREKCVKTYKHALWSPTTSSVDPKEVCQNLLRDLIEEGVDVALETSFVKRGQSDHEIVTTKGVLKSNYVINAAGLYADKIAKQYGFSEDYEILPFKGLYLYVNTSESLGAHVYPVPDLRYPFLGVHYTLTVDGQVKIGPTAIPALWRENYGGFKGFSANEFASIGFRELAMFMKDGDEFRKLALGELKKYKRSTLLNEAKKLSSVKIDERSVRWGKPGIRAQLVNIKNSKIEMDFVYQGDSSSFHILNAVSPAFTCSFAIAEYITKRIVELFKS